MTLTVSPLYLLCREALTKAKDDEELSRQWESLEEMYHVDYLLTFEQYEALRKIHNILAFNTTES